ncbi:YraN family protein [Aquifex sp.]
MNKKGKVFEDIAESYLKSKGYTILGRNIRTPFGEIDILAEIKGKKVVVEVKGGTAFNPVENFTLKKLERVYKSALYILESEDFQIDLIVVFRGKIDHYKNVERFYGEP